MHSSDDSCSFPASPSKSRRDNAEKISPRASIVSAGRSSRQSFHHAGEPRPMSHNDSAAFTPWDNPMGTDGFEFIEYAAPDPAAMGKVFEQMGFRPIARHRHKNVLLYRQGTINFIVNAEPD